MLADHAQSIQHARPWVAPAVPVLQAEGLDSDHGPGSADHRAPVLEDRDPVPAWRRRRLKQDARSALPRAVAAAASSSIRRPRKAR